MNEPALQSAEAIISAYIKANLPDGYELVIAYESGVDAELAIVLWDRCLEFHEEFPGDGPVIARACQLAKNLEAKRKQGDD